MQTATADPLVGRTLEGRYRIIDRIARGGMSTVYSAVDERLDRLVAVKVMSSALSADPAFSDRFAREARAAARLTHLNTVAVYDQGIDSGVNSGGASHVFLVMELVQGRTLRDLIRERSRGAPGTKGEAAGTGRFAPAEALSILQPVLSALTAAHAAGIVHRDIKPENILLSDDGVVKVADFGLARAVEADASSTRTGLMMGTVAYCSPEQITRGHADPRSDVYACGVVLFELLTGKPPYQGESAMNVAYQHVHSRVPAPSSKVKGIPSEIDELVVMATDSDPSGRPADAGEFLAEISDVRDELNLPVTPVPARPRPPVRRDRAGARGPTSDAHATEVIANGRSAPHDTQVVHGNLTAPASRPPAGPPPPVVIPPPKRKQLTEKQRRRRRGLIALLVVILLGIGAGVAAWWFAAGRYSKVPDLRSDSKATAIAALKDAGYKLGSVGSDFSETVPKNEVIKTDPGIGSRLERGKSVSFTISLGKYRIAVPNLQSLTIQKATSALNERGLPNPNITSAYNDTVVAGDVIKSTPKAGTKVKKSQVVTIVVSKGPPTVKIPDIAAGTAVSDADSALKNAGFKVKHEQEFSDTVPKDTVVRLSPTGSALKGSVVTVTVSKGPQLVTIPGFVPLSTKESDLTSQLTDLGLAVEINHPYGPDSPDAVVLSTDPHSGVQVKVGSTVTLTVY